MVGVINITRVIILIAYVSECLTLIDFLFYEISLAGGTTF